MIYIERAYSEKMLEFLNSCHFRIPRSQRQKIEILRTQLQSLRCERHLLISVLKILKKYIKPKGKKKKKEDFFKEISGEEPKDIKTARCLIELIDGALQANSVTNSKIIIRRNIC